MTKRRILTTGLACLKASLLSAAILTYPATVTAQNLDLSIIEPETKSRNAIRRLTATVDQLRLEGEVAEVRLPLYAPRDEALQYRTLQVDYLTAVSAAPERSSLRVLVNNQFVGEIEIKAGEQNTLRSFNLRPGLISEGFNEVRFVANHRHRVDCSIPATYELWTALNPSNTGFVFDPGSRTVPQVTSNLDILRAIPNDDTGAAQFQIVQPGGASVGNLDRALTVAQAVAVFGKYQNPVVKIRNQPGAGAGIDIIVGTRADLVQAGFDIDNARSEIPGLVLIRHPATGRISLIISAENRLALDKTIEAFQTRIAQMPVTGTKEGIKAFDNKFGYKIDTNKPVSLADLGVSSQRFDGRLLQQDFAINLPDDFFVGDYGKATLSLNIDSLAELNSSNSLQVFANGAALASADLTRKGISARNPLNIPLGGFSPGYNELRLEVSSLTQDDEVCNVAEAVSSDRLLLNANSSSIQFDTFARMRVTPSVAVKDVVPQGNLEGRPTFVMVPAGDPKSLEAASQIVIAASAINQQVRPVSLVVSNTPLGNRPGLVVAPTNRLTGVARAAYAGTHDADSQSGGSGIAGFLKLNHIDENDEGLWLDMRRYLASAWRGMGFKLSPTNASGEDFKLAKNDIIVTQRTTQLSARERWIAFLGAPVKQDAWTVVTGLTSDDIKSGVDSMLQEGRFTWLKGDTALYNAQSGELTATQRQEANYFASVANPSEWHNSRLVVAGVVSHNMLAFVLFMGAFCLLLAFTYFLTLRNSGR